MWEDKPQIGTKVFATYLIEKVLVYRMDKDIFNKPIRKKRHPTQQHQQKWVKDMI